MLTEKQLAARQGKLTASRVGCLMTGDKAKIMQLYLEMTGQTIPEDLSLVWPVRLGEATESLNLEWYACKAACTLSRQGEVVTHPKYDWAAATLDAWDNVLACPVETKHVGGREPLEVVIDRYQPQLQWQMACTGAGQAALSIISGVNEPIIEYIDYAADYAAEMLRRGRTFMEFVWTKKPPVDMPPIEPPADAHKVYDMNGSNAWGAAASVWRETKPQADTCKEAEKILKSLVPEDAKKCHGHGVQITRDRTRRLSLREAK
jgi:predicted phage-related endonuclease